MESNLHRIAINDLVLSFVKIELIQEITPVKGYVDMIVSEKFGAINDKQKEKLHIVQKQVDRLLSLVSEINVAKLDEIIRDNSLQINDN